MKTKLLTIALAALIIGILCSCEKDTVPEKKLPEGALAGEFSVAEGKKVHFSKGNLYYDGSAFKFEANQYDVYDRWDASHVSHFYWSTSPIVAISGIYHTEIIYHNDVFFTNDTPNTAKKDFTVNGVTGQYRTLSKAEWQYLFNTRTMIDDGARYENLTSSGIEIEGILFKGVVLFPDNFTDQTNWKTNEKYDTWEKLKTAGLVFLPTTGYRSGFDFDRVGDYGYYWSSSAYDNSSASNLLFNSSYVYPDSIGYRRDGYSVRLIIESK